MQTSLQTTAKTDTTSASARPATGRLLQRKCACGGSPGPSGECAACRRKRLLKPMRPPTRIRQAKSESRSQIAAQSPEEQRISLVGFSLPLAEEQKQENESRTAEFDVPMGDPKRVGVRLAKHKAGCVVPNSFVVTLGTNENKSDEVTGLMAISFKGQGRTRYPGGYRDVFSFGKRMRNSSGKICDCDCMAYQQFIRGHAYVRSPGHSDFEQVRTFKSATETLPLLPVWQRENISSILGISTHGCERDYEDHPGIETGAAPGYDIRLRYNFLLQIWDICQQKALKESRQTLTISGDTQPRTIKWEPGWQSLSEIMPRDVGDFSSPVTSPTARRLT